MNQRLTPAPESAARLCLRHRRVDGCRSDSSTSAEALLIPDLIEAVASIERLVDALRRDMASSERTLDLLSEAYDASVEYRLPA